MRVKSKTLAFIVLLDGLGSLEGMLEWSTKCRQNRGTSKDCFSCALLTNNAA